jgi:hypothetical protein
MDESLENVRNVEKASKLRIGSFENSSYLILGKRRRGRNHQEGSSILRASFQNRAAFG